MNIVIDGVIFQLQAARPLGIGRLWRSLIPKMRVALLPHTLTILRRRGFPPPVPDLPQVEVPPYPYGSLADMDGDDEMLASICRELKAGLFLSTYYTRAPGFRNVLTVYDLIPEVMGFDLSQPEWVARQRAIATAEKYVAISQATKDDLIRIYGVDETKITVAHCGVSPLFVPAGLHQIEAFRRKLGLSGQYILLVGNRGLYKSCLTTLQAVAMLSDEGIQVLAVGGPGLSPEEAVAAQGRRMTTVPWLSDEELAIAYSGALALAYPSRYEGFGLPVLEAMACGCPVITTHSSAIPEVGGDAVLYVDPEAPENVAAALKQVLNPDVRVRLAIRGIERARGFTWHRMAEIVSVSLTTGQSSGVNHLPAATTYHSAVASASEPLRPSYQREQRASSPLTIVVAYRGVPHARGWATGDCLVRALRRLGHKVYAYGNYYRCGEKLEEGTLPPRADLLIYCECNDHDPQYQELSCYPAGCKAYWDFDTHMHPQATFDFVRAMRFDLVFFANKLYAEQFEALAAKAVFLPYAFDDERFFPDPGASKTVEAALIGSPFPERLRFLEELHRRNLPVQLINGRYREHYVAAINELKVHLNYYPSGGRGLLVGRVWETIGCATLLLTERADFIEEFFEDGKHLVLYSGEEECADKLRYLLANDAERERIARQGWLHGLSHHTYLARAQTILASIGMM